MRRFTAVLAPLSLALIAAPCWGQGGTIQTELKAEQLAGPLAAGLPYWTKGYSVRIDPSGRLYLFWSKDNCNIFVVPEAWEQYRLLQAAGTKTGEQPVNYGVDVNRLVQGQLPGTVLTNDPNFNPAALGTSTQQPCNPDDPSCPVQPVIKPSFDASSLLLPIALLVVAAALVFQRRRPA